MPAWLVEWFSAGPEAWPTLPARPKDSLPPRGRFGSWRCKVCAVMGICTGVATSPESCGHMGNYG